MIKEDIYQVICEVDTIDYDCVRKLTDDRFFTSYNGYFGCIDECGREIIPCIYNDIYVSDSETFLIKYKDYYMIIDKNGNLIKELHDYSLMTSYNCGLSMVKNKNTELYGYVDSFGKEVIPCIYQDAQGFKENLARVSTNGRRWGYIDTYGNLVIPEIYIGAEYFQNGVAVVESIDGIGLIDKGGIEILPCKYNDIRVQDNGVVIVCGRGTNKCELKNTKGENISENKYIYIEDYNEGEEFGQALKLSVQSNDIVKCFVDTTGNEFEIKNRAKDWSKPYCGLVRIKKSRNLYEFINKENETVIPEIACVYVGNFHFDVAMMAECSKVGIIDKTGKKVIPTIYDSIAFDMLDEGFIIVQKNDKKGILDKQGNTILPCKFKDIDLKLNMGMFLVTLESNQKMLIDKNMNKYAFTRFGICKVEEVEGKLMTSVYVSNLDDLIDKMPLNIRKIQKLYSLTLGDEKLHFKTEEEREIFIETYKNSQEEDGKRKVKQLKHERNI